MKPALLLAAGAREHQPQRVGAGFHLGAYFLDPGVDLVCQRVPLRGAGEVDGLAALAALGRLDEQLPADLDDLAVYVDDTASG
jgi:hypothetical protein